MDYQKKTLILLLIKSGINGQQMFKTGFQKRVWMERMKHKTNKLEETIIFRCQKPLFEALKRMAKEQGISISQLIRSLLEENTTE